MRFTDEFDESITWTPSQCFPEDGDDELAHAIEACVTFGIEELAEDASTRVSSKILEKLAGDRFVMREVVGPEGSGKTALASAYAHMYVGADRTLWVTGCVPEFITLVESDLACVLNAGVSGALPLVVIDDLPVLGEGMTEKLSESIDKMLDAGWEVLVCSMPSHDTLGTFQRDRVLVTAQELDNGSSKGQGDSQVAALALAIYDEELDAETRNVVTAMFLLGSGSFADLVRMNVKTRMADLKWLGTSFPMLGIQMAEMRFDTCLRNDEAFVEAFRDVVLPDGSIDLGVVRTALHLLIERRRAMRAFLGAHLLLNTEQRHLFVVRHLEDLFDVLTLPNTSGWMVDVLVAQTHTAGDVMPQGDKGVGSGLVYKACGDVVRLAKALVDGDGQDASEQALVMLELLRESHLSHEPGDEDGSSELAGPVIEALGIIWLIGLVPFQSAQNAPEEPQRRAPVDLAVYRRAAYMLSSAIESDGEAPLYAAPALLFAQAVAGKPVLKKSANKALKDIRERLDQGARNADTRIALHFMCASLTIARLFGVRSNALWHGDMTMLVSEYVDQAIASLPLSQASCFTAALLEFDRQQLVGSGASTWKGLAERLSTAHHAEVVAQREASAGFAILERQARLAADEGEDIEALGIESASMAIPNVRVNLLGGFELVVDGVSVEVAGLSKRKGREALALLVMRRGRELSRDQLGSILWPDASEASRITSLYSTWGLLRESMIEATGVTSCPYLVRSGLLYRIDARYVSSDIEEFDVLTRRLLKGDASGSGPQRYRDAQDARAHEFISRLHTDGDTEEEARLRMFDRVDDLYCGELLGDAYARKLGDFTSDNIRERMTEVMLEGAYYAASLGMNRRSNWYAMRAIEVGGKKEEFYRARMKAQVELGQRSGALDTYFKMQRFLHEQQGIGPSQESGLLYQGLLADDYEQNLEAKDYEPGQVAEDEASVASDEQ